MIVALVDNGSLEPAAHVQLRALATALSERAGVEVHAVSWKHSDRIPSDRLSAIGDQRSALSDQLSASGSSLLAPSSQHSAPALTLTPFVRARFAAGEREFLFVPFFISPQGAIGSTLRGDLEALRAELGAFSFAFTAGLADRGAVPAIVADRIRETITSGALARPAVVVVDHGGPSAVSAALRDRLAAEVRALLGGAVGLLVAASMEGAHGPHLADILRSPEFSRGEVVVAPLFLAPGRHAGADGDLAQIARAAAADCPALRCHFTALVGSHPRAVAELALALRAALAEFPAPLSA